MPALWLAAALASAGPAFLPAYDDVMIAQAWLDLDRRIVRACRWPGGEPGVGSPAECQPAKLQAAAERATHYLTHLGPDARLYYQRAMAYRLAERFGKAITDLRTAARLDPDRVEAHSDLGELLAMTGDLEGARAAFTEVTQRVPDGPRAWYGWFQLAQLDAREGRTEDLIHHLRQAIRFGFSFRWLAHNPLWTEAYANPEIKDALDRLARVYDPDDTLRTLNPDGASP